MSKNFISAKAHCIVLFPNRNPMLHIFIRTHKNGVFPQTKAKAQKTPSSNPIKTNKRHNLPNHLNLNRIRAFGVLWLLDSCPLEARQRTSQQKNNRIVLRELDCFVAFLVRENKRDQSVFFRGPLTRGEARVAYREPQDGGCEGYLKYVLKSSLMRLPVFGWVFHVMEFIPVERKWVVDEFKMCRILQKHASENGLPVLKNVLLPKTKGFYACLETLRDSLDADQLPTQRNGKRIQGDISMTSQSGTNTIAPRSWTMPLESTLQKFTFTSGEFALTTSRNPRMKEPFDDEMCGEFRCGNDIDRDLHSS
ncbi:1-acyl-sn-glycerol-3-phosphate acyltransferase [Striga asiatica]|uniref:1-acyl-sn-glycerol-3-phosphate acyltransferase n=1 Tax=Striga asiatica TaxID=4170 RepID=A0A5A7QE65_STRAF|nr:1-acyl-sn-glycerol-3-phosphate acyltransferase [Striga asiatica]